MRTIQLQILYLIPKFNFNPRGKERTEYGPENFRTVAQCGIRSRRVIDKTKNSTMNNFVSNGILIKKKKRQKSDHHIYRKKQRTLRLAEQTACVGTWVTEAGRKEQKN